jgi:glutamate-1-semialdehyde 2,1-aminomutase
MAIPYCDPARCPAAGCAPVTCAGLGLASNEELFARSQRVIPGGVSSPVRAFRSVGGTPYFVARAHGAHVWDAEGRQLIDLVQSYGAIILGHAHPHVVEAVSAAAADGTSYGAPTAREMKLAEAIRERVPSCEQVRFVNSGTEATMTALRLARGITGRARVVKFAGNYHGHGDALLAAGGSGVATLGLSGSAGVTDAAVSQTVVAPYNVVPTLDEDVACVIVEPVAANMGLVPPAPGFLEGLRAACDGAGALLVFDEVITGFRLGPGGAQATYGVEPDLTCFGKVIGGGLPVGAFGGRAELMASLAPLGPVYQAGTLSGNPLATAAGLAALDLLDDGVHSELARRASRLGEGLRDALDAAGIPVTVPVVGPLLGLHFSATPAVDYETARRTDEAMYARFFHALLDEGVALAPGAYEVAFPGLAHDDAIVDEILTAANRAATTLT